MSLLAWGGEPTDLEAITGPTSVPIVSESVAEDHPLASLAFDVDERQAMISASAANFTISFSGPEGISESGHSSIELSLTDTAGETLVTVLLENLTGDLCSELVDHFLSPDKHVISPWRELTVPEEISQNSEVTTQDEPIQPGKKRTIISGELLLAAIRKASAEGAEVLLALEEERQDNSASAAIVRQIKAGAEEPTETEETASTIDSAREFVSAYERRVDVVGLRNNRKKEIKEYLDSQPSVRCLEFSNSSASLVPASTSDLSQVIPSGGEVRWIDISKPDEAMLESLATDFGVPQRFIENIKTNNRIAHHQEEDGYLLVGQHILKDQGEEVVEQEVHFLFKDNLIISITDQSIDALGRAFERLADEKQHTPTSAQDVYIEIAYDFLINNKEAPGRTQAWVSRTHSAVAKHPLQERKGIAQHSIQAGEKLNRMQRIFAGQNELLKAVDGFYGLDQRTARSVKREQSIEVGLESVRLAVENQKTQLNEMKGIRHDANESLLAKSVLALTGVSFATLWSPWFNNQLAIPGQVWPKVALATTAMTVVGIGLLARNIWFKRDSTNGSQTK